MTKTSRIALIATSFIALAACSRVGNGEVGVRYHTMGSDRGVEPTPVGMGWYFTGPGTAIETFPTFTQTYNWTEKNAEQFSFADSGGLNVTADMGITYHVDPVKTPGLFQKYRRGIDEITDMFVHNMVRDALVDRASQMPIEDIYGPGRAKLLVGVQSDISKLLHPLGIEVERLYWIGNLGLPSSVKASINAKTVAIQRAQQVENEVAQTKAEAQKAVAEAQGQAQAITARAQAQADANQKIANSLTPNLVEYMKIQKWDGHLPRVSGGSNLISMPEPK